MKSVLLGTAIAVLFGGSAAFGQWLYQGNESEFGDAGLHVALTGSGNYGFGLRCQGQKIEVVYITQDTSFDKDTYEVANVTKPKLRIRIDKGQIIDLGAQLVDLEGKMGVLADTDKAMLNAVSGAKSKVSVVIELLGENYHETSFQARGSRAAVQKMVKGCGLD